MMGRGVKFDPWKPNVIELAGCMLSEQHDDLNNPNLWTGEFRRMKETDLWCLLSLHWRGSFVGLLEKLVPLKPSWMAETGYLSLVCDLEEISSVQEHSGMMHAWEEVCWRKHSKWRVCIELMRGSGHLQWGLLQQPWTLSSCMSPKRCIHSWEAWEEQHEGVQESLDLWPRHSCVARGG